MSFPRMSLHIGDYRKDTGHLRAAGHGAYLLLIMHYWATGALPDDDEQLATISCMSDREWKKWRPILVKFFEPGWKHNRIEEELVAAQEKYQRLAEAGSKGGKAKALASPEQRHKPRSSDATAPPKQPITDNQTDHHGDSARARDRLISDEAMQAADEIAVICGHDAKNLPVRWCGAANVVQSWMNLGWEKALIVQVAKAVVAEKRDGPPKSINYFFNPIAQELARRNQPLPCVTPEASNASKSPRTTANRSSRGAAQQDAQLAGMAAALRKHPGSRLYDGGGGRAFEAGERDGDPTGVRAIAGPKT